MEYSNESEINMKITMYELLGMIKDGKVPKKIKYNGSFYEFDDKKDNYYENETCSINWNFVSLHRLNNEVEILEEEKKIPEKLEYYDDSIAWVIDDVGQLSDVDKVIIDKLNEVLDYLKSKGE